ncbi:MAG: ribosome silencing factor [Deltaproteobacteria bacterium]|nr:ribosome silencing factor [Deltaproteobacteria bacterium]
MIESGSVPPSQKDETTALALTLGRLAQERQAEDMVLLDVREFCSYTDFMLILSGRSSRQVQSLADHILRQAKKLGFKPVGREGVGQGRWVLLDYGPVVIHLFLEETRVYYDLEGLWSEAPKFEWSETGQPPRL